MSNAYNFTVITPSIEQPATTYPGMMYEMHAYFDVSTLVGNTLNAGDTITTPVGFIPDGGVVIFETEVINSEIDTNATPTATFELGDLGSSYASLGADPSRFILTTAVNAHSAAQVETKINQFQTLTNGVVTKGEGLLVAQSNYQLVWTAVAAAATTASTGYIRLVVRYLCTGA